MPDVLTMREAAAWLRLSERSLYELARGRRVPAAQVGGKWLFPRAQLERWLAVFPREQLLVVRSEDLGRRPADTYAEILSFLGAAPHALEEYPRIFGREYADMPPETRLTLAARFAEPNRRLEALLGRDLDWA